MIRNAKKLEEFEKQLVGIKNLPYPEQLKIYGEVIKKAIAANAFTEEYEKESREAKIRLAKALNSLK